MESAVQDKSRGAVRNGAMAEDSDTRCGVLG